MKQLHTYLLILIALLIVDYSYAEDMEDNYTDEDVFVLDAIDVIKKVEKSYGNEITKEDIDKFNSQDLTDSLKYTPGIIMNDSSNARGESSFTVRGFDSVNVPIILDGITVNSPFNGRGDSSSLLVGDLESINIQKGYTDTLFGGGGMGGAVLLKTSKPKKKFDFSEKITVEFDNRFDYSSVYNTLSLGTKNSKFYAKTTLQYRNIDHTRLSEKYEPIGTSIQQDKERMYSDREDLKVSLVTGTTPIENLDLWLSYYFIDSNRGLNPPEVFNNYSLLEWDYWVNHSISLNGKYDGDRNKLEFIGYFNKYDNKLKEYSSFAHIEYDKPFKETVYDEFTGGFAVNDKFKIIDSLSIEGLVSYKNDSHIGYRNEKTDIIVKEESLTFNVGLEYTPLKQLRVAGSLGFDVLFPIDYYTRQGDLADELGYSFYNVDSRDIWLLNGQIGVFSEFIKDNELRLTYARKNQFPTMNDRYSTRISETFPNPNLKPEIADHVELGYKGLLFNAWKLDAALYFSRIQDKMATITIPDPSAPMRQVDYITNLDSVFFYGFEFSTSARPVKQLELGLNLSVNKYHIAESVYGAEVMTYYPEFTSNFYLRVMPCKYIEIMPILEYSSDRYTDLDGYNKLNDYILAHLHVTFNIIDNLKLELTFKNITDADYSLRAGFPMKGRTYGLTATYTY